MKRIISIILLSASLFAGNLEVDGGITATGEIQSPTIDALRDDGQYEYIIYFVHMTIHINNSGYIAQSGYKRLDSDDFATSANNNLNSMVNFNSDITQLFNDGWKLDSINNAGGTGNTDKASSNSWWILKRPIEE